MKKLSIILLWLNSCTPIEREITEEIIEEAVEYEMGATAPPKENHFIDRRTGCVIKPGEEIKSLEDVEKYAKDQNSKKER